MAQYFEVLSQSDTNVEQGGQFFNGNQENEPTQVQYILADDSRQFQTQQLVLSADQVMVVDGSQQQIQGVVIDQSQITYQQANSAQQYSAVVQNTNLNNQPAQQIYYMETNNGRQVGETVRTIIEQPSPIQQNTQSSPQPQQIVLNHQIGTSSPHPGGGNRPVVQAAPAQRPVLHIRQPLRQGHVPGNPQNRPLPAPMRQGLPQQVRPHQSTPVQMRPMGQQIQMRLRAPVQQIRQQAPQIQPRPAVNSHNDPKNMVTMINRQLSALQQKQRQQSPSIVHQQQQSQQVAQQQQHQQPQQVIQQNQPGNHLMPNQVQKTLSEFQRQQQLKNNEHDELDDHDPSMNSTPSQMVNQYRKFLDQKKHPVLARLPSNVKVTPVNTNSNVVSIAQAIDEVVHQANQQQQAQQQQQAPQPQQQQLAQQQQPQQLPPNQQQHHVMAGIQQPQANVTQDPHVASSVPGPQKKARAPARPRNPNPTPRSAAGGVRPRLQRPQTVPQNFGPPRAVAPQTPQQAPRFALNQQQPRFSNPQQMIPPRLPQHQQVQQPVQQQPQPPQPVPPPQPPPQPAQPDLSAQPQRQIQQNGGNQSQMNYLITPPTPNRPRQQRPLPSYIPSSQIQQIIESTPIAEEFSDSIRMLVLLENGEQRLITFTLPKEACTIQEILEQVNVPFTPETNIQVTEANTNGINYIVTVGNVSNIAYANEEEPQEAPSPESQPMAPHPPNRQMPPTNNGPSYPQKSMPHEPLGPVRPPLDPPKPPSPEPPKELPKLIPGKLAVCVACGYTGEDFNRCTRCLRKLPDTVRSIDSLNKTEVQKPILPEITKHLPNTNTPVASSTPVKQINSQKPESGSGKVPSPVKKKTSKSKPVEHESVVISSDEEEDEKKPVKSVSEQLLKNLGASISISPVTKEPSLTEIKKHVRKLASDPVEYVKINLSCRTIRIGSYRFVSPADVIIDSKCVIIKAPVIDKDKEIKTLRIDRGDIVKVLVCFNKSLPVIFYYLNVGAAPIIREMLNMKKESGLYYDPIDEKEDSYRKITLLPEHFGEENKVFFNSLYGSNPYNIMDELTAKEANDILIKACPKDTSTAANMGSFSEIKQILLYPKEGQGRLSINTEDYVCLAVDQFLNDKIIDFYLKYLWHNLPPAQQEKVHIFSTFFYKRLTTIPTKAARKSHPFESDPTLSAAEKRHCRVKNWTKKINIFEKDFIIVPINENAHWFLAIICFPGMKGPQTFDGKPYTPEPKPVKAPKKKPAVKKEKPIPCDDPMLSDKDEAESEDSDMESDDSDESAASAAAAVAAPVVAPPSIAQVRGKNGARVPIKQPCILIFDSLAGPNRSRVKATLRDYLTVEYKTKMDTERVFNKDVIKGAACKVPQQNNFTDCGLYVLQYVEQFFKDPIKDYNIPIKGINDWFEEIVVTKKREDICKLIKSLMEEAGTDTNILPDIALPTLDGNLVERQETERDPENGEEEQEDMFTDIEDSEMTDVSANISKLSDENGDSKTEENLEQNSSSGENSPPGSLQSSPLKPSVEGISEKSDTIATVTQPVLKPSLSEFPIPRQTSNKDTLNYLKSKRIIRHKPSSEGPDYKKTKFDD